MGLADQLAEEADAREECLKRQSSRTNQLDYPDGRRVTAGEF